VFLATLPILSHPFAPTGSRIPEICLAVHLGWPKGRYSWRHSRPRHRLRRTIYCSSSPTATPFRPARSDLPGLVPRLLPSDLVDRLFPSVPFLPSVVGDRLAPVLRFLPSRLGILVALGGPPVRSRLGLPARSNRWETYPVRYPDYWQSD